MRQFFLHIRSGISRKVILHVLAVCGILLVGLTIRLLLSPAPGYDFDVGVDQGWGESALKLGIARSYLEQVNGNMLPNYAPFSLMLFESMAFLYQTFFSSDFQAHALAYRILIKVPAIVCDLLTAGVLYDIVARWKGTKFGYIAAIMYVLHPAVFHDSAFWGQTDSIYTLFLVTAIAAFLRKWMTVSGALFALALLTKVQAVMLAPFFLFLFIGAGWKAFLKGAFGGIIVAVAVLLPFIIGGTLKEVYNVYVHSVGYYSMISSAAYNFWWAMYGDPAGSTSDTGLVFNVLSFRSIGLILTGIFYAYILAMFFPIFRSASKDAKRMTPILFLMAAYIAFMFFLWNTQMHERYLFPFIAFGLPMAFINARAAFLYGAVSLCFYLNLLGWLPAGPVDRAVFGQFPSLDIFIASFQVILFFSLTFFVMQNRRRLLTAESHQKKH